MAGVTLDGGGTGAGGGVSVPARTVLANPLSTAGPLLYSSAPATTGHGLFVQADGTLAWAAQSGGGGGGAPTDAQYIVSAAHAGLSAERVVTDNSEIAWDTGTAGQLKAALAALGVTLAKIGTGIFTADATGRGKFANSFVNGALIEAAAVTMSKTDFHLGPYTATAANDFDLTSLLGDAANGYDIHIRGSAASSAFFDILLNGTDTCDNFMHGYNDRSTDPSTWTGGSDTAPGVISATADNYVHIKIWTKSGVRRGVQTRSRGVYSGNKREYILSGEWTDTSAVVSSLRLRLAGGVNWTAGTIATARAF